jgi:hypothetical protein
VAEEVRPTRQEPRGHDANEEFAEAPLLGAECVETVPTSGVALDFIEVGWTRWRCKHLCKAQSEAAIVKAQNPFVQTFERDSAKVVRRVPESERDADAFAFDFFIGDINRLLFGAPPDELFRQTRAGELVESRPDDRRADFLP